MADLLVQDLDPAIHDLLRRRAEAAGRLLQLEVRSILEGAARATDPGAQDEGRSAREEATRQEVGRIRAGFEDRVLSDSAEIIRAMRDAARTWGDEQGKYLTAAVTFVDRFDGWFH